MNTTEFLTIAAAICPDREAIIFEGKRFTFQQLNERVNRLANALKKMGVKKGDKVSLIQVNCNQCVETYFAVAKAGGMYVPLNFRAKGDELEYMINFAEISVLFLGARYIDIINPIRTKLNTVKHYISIESKRDDMHFYEDIIAKSPDDEPTTDIHDNDTTILMFTAGTTGRPKAVMLTHDNFTNYVLSNVTPADPTVE